MYFNNLPPSNILYITMYFELDFFLVVVVVGWVGRYVILALICFIPSYLSFSILFFPSSDIAVEVTKALVHYKTTRAI